MTTKEQERAQRLLALPSLNRRQVSDLMELSRHKGATPQPTGHRNGVAYWSQASLREWFGEQLQHRSASTSTVEFVRASSGDLRPTSWNAERGTFTTVVSSEAPATMLDWAIGGVVREILLGEGGNFADVLSLHVDHQQNNVDKLVGRAFNPRREDSMWVMDCELSTDAYSREIGTKIERGVIRAVSIGYRVYEYEVVQPGDSAVVSGRTFHNEYNVPLKVSTVWRAFEVSLVSIGADENALIRSATIIPERNQPMPAIHSHTARIRRGSFVAATLMENGFNDPTKHRWAMTLDGPKKLADHPDLHRDAEGAHHLMGRDPMDRLRLALELDGIRAIDTTEVLGRAHHLGQSRSFSTSNVAAMYNDEFVSLLYAHYDAQGDSTRGWCAENDLLTLKKTPRPRLGAVELKVQNPQSGATHIEFFTTEEQAQLGVYSGQFVLDEQDILDGSWGARAAAAALGVADAAKALRPNLVYGFLRRNPVMADGVALFHASHGNLNTSAPLGTAGKLAASLAGIGKQKDGQVALNLPGEYLIAPVALQGAGAGAIQTLELIDAGSTQPPKLRTDSRLDNGLVDPYDGTGGTVHAGDATSWYTSTAGQYGVEVQYRSGFNRAPEFRSGPLTRGTFGMWFDIRHFVGVTAVGYQGISKNTA